MRSYPPEAEMFLNPLIFECSNSFATSRLQEILAAKGGTTWARSGWWILPENDRLPRNIQGSFTCRKSTTWDRQLYFPSEGRSAEEFFAQKNPKASVRFEPVNLGTKGQHATSRPPKPPIMSLKLSVDFDRPYFSTDTYNFEVWK